MLLNFIDTCTTRPSRLFYYFPDGETKTITAATRKMIFFFFIRGVKCERAAPDYDDGLHKSLTIDWQKQKYRKKKNKYIFTYIKIRAYFFFYTWVDTRGSLSIRKKKKKPTADRLHRRARRDRPDCAVVYLLYVYFFFKFFFTYSFVGNEP